ncbi:MAG: CDP-alcohol phosphatidyltransferase family protein [Eubacteriales bacterium]|nr:CDP-alcohol phosphatidyltransferase family protein [Eubacteriales bacterium]
MKIGLPNIITSVRFAAIPVMAYFIYASAMIDSKYNVIAFVLFVLIWATDVLDGFIARKYDQVTNFGKLFDPFVDKLFQFVTALMMMIVGRLPLWVPCVIFVKELLMLIGGTLLLTKYKLVVYSKWYGKAATVLFVFAFCILFFIPQDSTHLTGYLFVLPLLMSLIAYGKYFADNVVPVVFRKSAGKPADPAKVSGVEIVRKKKTGDGLSKKSENT